MNRAHPRFPFASQRFLRPIFLAFVTLFTGGCNIESMWTVPASHAGRPSRLWSTDPRTAAWDGVEVQYCLLLNDEVDADVHSLDGRHHFTAHGIYWYETDRGEKPVTYEDQSVLVVEFDGHQQQYRFDYRPGKRWPILAMKN